MNIDFKKLGKVRPTVEGDWNKNKSYRELSIVFDEESNKSYISKKPVPSGISILNKNYWYRFGNNRIDSDSILILSHKDDTGYINSFTLKEAINSINIEDRRLGLFISFYEKPINSNGVYRWNLYQFNSNNIDNFSDISAWDSIYYNRTKFYGLLENEDILYKVKKNPNVGDYAFVGTSLGEAVVYRCYTKNIWKETTEKATEYLTILIQGTVTVGSNGNWFNDGVDTGIPAKGEKGDKPYLRYNDTTGNVEYSFDQTNWEVLVNKEEITGAAATVTVGTVTTLDENSNAQVTNSGTTNTAILNFKIPKGKTGDGLVIKGTYDTEELLKEKITSPKIGDNYVVGTAAPYHLWCYTNVYSSSTGSTTPQWKDLGELTKDTTIITQSLGDKEDIVPSQALLNKQVKNVGLDEYEEFSEAKAYSIGDIVVYNGLLYTFTANHAVGAWIGTDAKKTSQKIIFENRYGNYNVVHSTNYQDNSLILKNGNIDTTEYNFCIYTYSINKHSIINLYTYWMYGLDKTRYLAVGLYNGDTFVKGIEIVEDDQIDLTTSILNDEADTIKVLCSNIGEAPLIYQKDICVYDKNEDDLFAWKDKIDDDNVFVRKLSPNSIQRGKLIAHKTGEYIANDAYDTVIYKIPANEYLIENSLIRVKTDIHFGVTNDYNIISLYSNGIYLNNRSLTGQSVDIVYHKAIFLANADEIRVICRTGYLPIVEIGESFDSKEFFFKKEKISFTDYYENTLIRTNGSITSYNGYCI